MTTYVPDLQTISDHLALVSPEYRAYVAAQEAPEEAAAPVAEAASEPAGVTVPAAELAAFQAWQAAQASTPTPDVAETQP